MFQDHDEEPYEESRPGSVSDDDDNDTDTEATHLLPKDLEPTLYRTISRISEQEPLPPDDADIELQRSKPRRASISVNIWATLSVLLLGVFVSNADQSLVLATYSKVSSEFNDLSSGSWLISAYILAQCAAQPLYGKLSDIYGRKSCLQASYILFAVGTTGSGLGQTMGQVIVSRAVQGAGGAGMISMVSIIITDLVPLHEVATLRSYVNILQTTGRSCGGVIGGVLTEYLGWRWAFLVQVPLVLLALVLVQWRLHITPKHGDGDRSKLDKLRSIDFVGAFFLTVTILAICLILDMGGQKVPWDSLLIKVVVVVGAIASAAFVISAKFVPEPIFPLRLLGTYAVATNCSIIVLQVMTQMSLMLLVPIFFQATKRASTGAAGAYLIPAFAGNTLGGLVAGYWIKRTGLFKPATAIAPIFAGLCMILCYYGWDAHTPSWKSLAIFPGGFAMGVVSSSAFVGLTAGVDEKDMAIAASGMYLFVNLGALAAISSGAAVFESSLRRYLSRALNDRDDGEEVMQRALSSISYVQDASNEIRSIVVPAYVESFHDVNLMGLCLSAASLVVAIFSNGQRLKM